MLYPQTGKITFRRLRAAGFSGLADGGDFGRSRTELNIGQDVNGALVPDAGRAVLTNGGEPLTINGSFADALVHGGKVFVLTDTALYRAGVKVSDLGFADKSRRLLSFGESLFVLPDGLLISPDGTAAASAGVVNVCTQAPAAALTLADGSTPVITVEGQTPTGGSCRIFTDSAGQRRLMKWDSACARWTEAGPVSVSLTSPGIGSSLRPGDGVMISSSGSAEVNGSHTLTGASDNSIVYEGLDAPAALKSGMTVIRPFPSLGCGVFFDERLWGAASDGSAVIACRRSDALNFSEAGGGVRIAVHTPGPFTAAAVLGGRLCFFKEDGIYTIVKKTASKSGSTVSSYSYTFIPAVGPTALSGAATAAAGGRLVWPAGEGLSVFDGSKVSEVILPQQCMEASLSPAAEKAYSAAFGETFTPGAAAADCAYASGTVFRFTLSGSPFLISYDTTGGSVHITDAPAAVKFVSVRGSPAALTLTGGGIGFTALDGYNLPDPALFGGDGWQSSGRVRWLTGLPLPEHIPGRLLKVMAGVVLTEGSDLSVLVLAKKSGSAVSCLRLTGPRRETAAWHTVTAPSGGATIFICGEGPARITGLNCDISEEVI